MVQIILNFIISSIWYKSSLNFTITNNTLIKIYETSEGLT